MTLRLAGSTSGFTEIDAPAVAGSNIIQLPAGNGSAYQIVRNGATAGSLEFADKLVSGTAQASTSGTAIDFTGIPSWAKRVTVMFDRVSLNGASEPTIQIGTSGGIQTTGYTGACGFSGPSGGGSAFSTGFRLFVDLAAANSFSGIATLCLSSVSTTGTWVHSGLISHSDGNAYTTSGAGSKTLSGTLDRVRITADNGTDTFDAGSINIMYE
jgi:hypothetical protein